MNFHNMFTDYCVIDKLNLDLSKISKYCYDKETYEKNNGIVNSNVGGWHSYNMSNDSELFIQELKNEVLIRIMQISTFTGRHLNLKYYISKMWTIINRKHDFNLLHSHPNCCFSGAFYVKCNKYSGGLVFTHSNKAFDWAFDPNTIKEYSPYTSQKYTIIPEENYLIIFPSYQDHYVEPNLSDSDRIVISFNVRIKND